MAPEHVAWLQVLSSTSADDWLRLFEVASPTGQLWAIAGMKTQDESRAWELGRRWAESAECPSIQAPVADILNELACNEALGWILEGDFVQRALEGEHGLEAELRLHEHELRTKEEERNRLLRLEAKALDSPR